MLAEDSAGNGGLDKAGTRSDGTARKTDVDLGLVAWCSGQEGLPVCVVEAVVQSTIDVDQVALWVVVELDPEAVELYGLQKVHHVLVVVKGALGSSSDDIGPPGVVDQVSQLGDHPGVSLVAG